MEPLNRLVLRADVSGMPLGWIDFQEAVKLYHLDQVAYSLGSYLYTIHGGYNAHSGLRSKLAINSIIATSQYHHKPNNSKNFIPPLNNHALFKRDNYICLYCGEYFRRSLLSRDHIIPVSAGGEDTWTNVVTACKRCNNVKAGRTPEQAKMQLIAIPFAPNRAEYVFLQGRKILSDQMEFLCNHFPRKSPLRKRLAG